MSAPDPYWCGVCREAHVVPSLARTHEQNAQEVTVTVDDCAPDCDERTNCPTVGGPGHMQCGRCDLHGQPRHHCGCVIHMRRSSVGRRPAPPAADNETTVTGL